MKYHFIEIKVAECKPTISFGDKRESAHNLLVQIKSTTKYLESNLTTHFKIKLLLFDASIPHLKIISVEIRAPIF